MRIAPGMLVHDNVLLLATVIHGQARSVSKNSVSSGGQDSITIGRHVKIASNRGLMAFKHATALAAGPMALRPLVEATIRIEDGVWNSAYGTLTAGVTIRSGATVAASSAVTRDLGSNKIVGGTPPKLIRLRTPDTHAR